MEVSLGPRYGLACQCSRALPRIPHVDIAIPPLEKVSRNLEYRAASQNSGWKGPSLFSVEEKSALHKGRPDLEKVSSEKWPLLHTAATSGDTFIVDRLIKSGANVNTLDKDGYSALQRAVMAKKEMSVNQLLQAKADAFIRDKGGATLLHYGVQTGSMNIVRWFIECGVEVNSSDKYGWTPLHLAVLTGRADIVRLLLVRGADKNLENKDGWTPLDLCFALGGPFNSVEVAKALKTYPKVKVKTGMI